MGRCAGVLWKDTKRLLWTSRCFVKVTLVWLFHLSQLKSAVIKWALHAEWHLLMSQHSQDTQALLGQVTGSVTLNKPAVPIEFERAGCWSARVNFRGLLGHAVSIVVTIAEPRCLMGRACCHSCQSNVHAGGLTFFFFFLSSSFFSAAHGTATAHFKQQWHVRRAHLPLLEYVRRRRSSSGGSWQLLCAPRLRCHIVRAATFVAAANRSPPKPPLSVWLHTPLI